MEYRWELHFGSLSIEVYPSGGLTVDILDTKTGEQTQVIIPLTICIVTILHFLLFLVVELIIISPQVLKRQLLVRAPATTLLKDLPKPKEPIVVGSINSEIKRTV
jgi:hypothetical protein